MHVCSACCESGRTTVCRILSCQSRSLKQRSLGTIRIARYVPLVSGTARTETPGTKFAGGHRSRVTPVPIPNTEVKPATADGTIWETVWESRSLPALILKTPDVSHHVGRFVCTPAVAPRTSRTAFGAAI